MGEYARFFLKKNYHANSYADDDMDTLSSDH